LHARRSIKASKLIAISAIVLSSFSFSNKALVNIKNGENFSGPAYPYNTARVNSIAVVGKGSKDAYVGRLGDYPALRPMMATPGIHSIAIETQSQTLTYDSWEKFTGFLEYHGFDGFIERHLERKLPKDEVTENYTRSAKTIIQVKDAGGELLSDTPQANAQNHQVFTPTGHEFEMIMLESPFGNVSRLQLQLIFQNKPVANRQVEMFWKGDKTERLTATTGDDGIAEFKLLGSGEYLLSAVHLTESISADAHWDSYWSSITFERQAASQ